MFRLAFPIVRLLLGVLENYFLEKRLTQRQFSMNSNDNELIELSLGDGPSCSGESLISTIFRLAHFSVLKIEIILSSFKSHLIERVFITFAKCWPPVELITLESR